MNKSENSDNAVRQNIYFEVTIYENISLKDKIKMLSSSSKPMSCFVLLKIKEHMFNSSGHL